MHKTRLNHLLPLLLLCSSAVLARGDDGAAAREWDAKVRPGVAPAEDTTYQTACGSCHFAYQPGLLPPLSWEQVMAGLADHFGKPVELSRSAQGELTNYLLNHAAGRENFQVSADLMAPEAGAAPTLRVTATRYFIARHQGVAANGDCLSCHPRAANGDYAPPVAAPAK